MTKLLKILTATLDAVRMNPRLRREEYLRSGDTPRPVCLRQADTLPRGGTRVPVACRCLPWQCEQQGCPTRLSLDKDEVSTVGSRELSRET